MVLTAIMRRLFSKVEVDIVCHVPRQHLQLKSATFCKPARAVDTATKADLTSQILVWSAAATPSPPVEILRLAAVGLHRSFHF